MVGYGFKMAAPEQNCLQSKSFQGVDACFVCKVIGNTNFCPSKEPSSDSLSPGTFTRRELSRSFDLREWLNCFNPAGQ